MQSQALEVLVALYGGVDRELDAVREQLLDAVASELAWDTRPVISL
jgi:hypothetical protein